MAETRRKDPGRRGRPRDGGGKTRSSRPAAGRSSGAALGRGRGRRRDGAGPPKARRTRRIAGARVTNPEEALPAPPRHGRKGRLAGGEA